MVFRLSPSISHPQNPSCGLGFTQAVIPQHHNKGLYSAVAVSASHSLLRCSAVEMKANNRQLQPTSEKVPDTLGPV